MRRNLGIGLLILAALVVAFVLYQNSAKKNVPLVFSARQMAEALFVSYKQEYLEPESGRTLDKQRDNITTSEGQGYTMLRAAWMGDREVFDRSLQWTNDNLRRPDNLFAWMFGNRGGGAWGVMEAQGGRNSASDGDTDIALSLLFAYARWKDDAYLTQAQEIIRSIWEKEVVTIQGVPYLASNDLEKGSSKGYIVVNPSYLAPYAYRIFAKVDRSHPWDELVDSSYALIKESSRLPLDRKKSVGLPPDWIRIDVHTGAIAAAGGDLLTNFGYDAFRTYFRVALDYQWTHDSRAKEILEGSDFLADYARENGNLPAIFAHDGTVISTGESPAVYGGVIGALVAADPELGRQIYEQKLISLYDPGANSWKTTPSYYDSNWIWFGIALYNGLLPDLTGLTGTSTTLIN